MYYMVSQRGRGGGGVGKINNILKKGKKSKLHSQKVELSLAPTKAKECFISAAGSTIEMGLIRRICD